jgi:hypothetical protein
LLFELLQFELLHFKFSNITEKAEKAEKAFEPTPFYLGFFNLIMLHFICFLKILERDF